MQLVNNSHFTIENASPHHLTLYVEPEGAAFALRSGEKVVVRDPYVTSPVVLRFSSGDAGQPIVSIWPGDGDVRVEKDGVNMLDTL